MYVPLGLTNIHVSQLGLGTLTMGPYQLDYPIRQGADLIVQAVKRGINLFDTAKAYQTYPYIAEALTGLNSEERKNLHIISRSYDYTYSGMKHSFEEALRETNLPTLSIFMLHEQESELTLKGHREALEFLVEMKTAGKLGAVGISTHYINAVKAAANHPDIDVIFAILNHKGIGIMDGTREEMEQALASAHEKGKGILIMKALGGGHLYREAGKAIEYIRKLPFVHSTILGMQDTEEMEYNLKLFQEGSESASPFLPRKSARKLFIEPWCTGCGNCMKECPFQALHVKHGRVSVDPDRCMLCSYCVKFCPDFCIKVV